ncbi:hypothetical protein [Microbacterium sp. KSW4-4]|uniref:hypothetical protein n=1 Tax=Microbacterium sp. KSW4-4 TaxID=2851651 RepID=UPI001FFD05C5|nr:hypothetical protein [Microbacterium sp. KSW4-4]MCK2034457.1 hypothetical protein [Microbacterium sp. KSW4-4]
MIDIAYREPLDQYTAEQAIERIIRDWNGPLDPHGLAAEIIEGLVYKAYFEQAEGALRWLNSNDEEKTVLERIGI